jgi:pimeloyl-ACP methyl ester carboxylesterase
MKTTATSISSAVVIFASVCLASIFSSSSSFTTPADAQQLLQTIEKRDLTIELDGQEQIQTRAQLTLPAVGDGPFPAVLLIHGSGAADMDGYIPPELSGTETGSRIFLQIAEYLSERGFVVLRYDKRGIGENATILDANVFGNATVQQLMQQPEVDRGNITLLGISEGTTIVPRIAAERSNIVKNIVLMSAASQTLYDIMYANLVNRTILFARELWDDNRDSFLSLQEVLAHPGAYLTVPAPSPATPGTNTDNATVSGNNDTMTLSNSSATANTNTTMSTQPIIQQQWYPGLDANNDTLVEIDQELIPFALALFAQTAAEPWLQSHKEIPPNLVAIENLVPTIGILILQGEEDNQTYLEQALLLEQKLTQIKYPNHTLITYPGLGHTFHPAQGLLQPLGPIEDYVLADLHSWLME